MTTDRELLELAAKAAGLLFKKRTEVVDADDNFIGIQVRAKWNDRYRRWNPSTDDGDEARLEAALLLAVVWYPDCVQVVSSTSRHEAIERYTDHGGDRQAARRRAGFRVAAEIGRMK